MNHLEKLDWNVKMNWILFERVQHCLGVLLHRGPGGKVPLLPPSVSGTANMCLPSMLQTLFN